MEKDTLILAEIDRRRQDLVDVLWGHPINENYFYLKGKHDALVDLMEYIEKAWNN